MRYQGKIDSWRSNAALTFTAAFVVFLAVATIIGRLPPGVMGIYLVASAIAFFAYAFDKSAAKNNRWRTRESTLHFFAVVGGWPGAFAAQRLLRHKSKKKSFKIVFLITVALNCGALGCLFTTPGVELFRSISNFK